MEFFYKTGNRLVEPVGQNQRKGQQLSEVCLLWSTQKDEELDENLFKQLEEIFISQCSFLWKTSLSLKAAERKTNTMAWKQLKKFPEACQQHLSSQMMHEPIHSHALLLLTNQEELLRGVIISFSLGGIDHVAVADSLLLREPGGHWRLRRANSSLLRVTHVWQLWKAKTLGEMTWF